MDLYGRVDESEALAKGETRFRTLPQILSEPVRNALEQAAGTPIANASFEILPLLTSPCDMYALGVLAIKLLLVDDENTLAIAVDEVLSLAKEIAVEYQPDVRADESVVGVDLGVTALATWLRRRKTARSRSIARSRRSSARDPPAAVRPAGNPSGPMLRRRERQRHCGRAIG